MQRGPLLLVFPLDWNWTDIAVTPGLEHPFDVGLIGPGALDVRTRIERRKQLTLRDR